MRKRHFLAAAAVLAVCMALLSAPVTAFATGPGDDYGDIEDEGQEPGEQMTVPAPDPDDGPGGGSSGGNTGGSSGGNTGGSSGGTTGGSSGSGNKGSSSGGSFTQNSGGGSSGTAGSSDSSLASLGISPGTLSPAFSPNVYEYTATVDADVTRVSIPARPNSSTAVIASVSGAKSIRPGTNTVKVVVEAANGTTSTYTITVQCGSGAQNPPASEPQDTSEPTSVEGEIVDGQTDGETVNPDETDEADKDGDSKVSFDSNGYLIYEGNAYIPSEQMPEGDYVSLEKYNSLYEQAQSDRTLSNRMMIIFVIALVLLLIVIVNLAFKLRDARQDAELGINGIGDDDMDGLPVREGKVTKAAKLREKAEAMDASMIPDVKMPEQMKRGGPKTAERLYGEKAKPAAAKKPVGRTAERSVTPAKTPDKKSSKSARADKDLEILDLNDL